MKGYKAAKSGIRFKITRMRQPKVHHRMLTPGPLRATVSRDWMSGLKGGLLSGRAIKLPKGR